MAMAHLTIWMMTVTMMASQTVPSQALALPPMPPTGIPMAVYRRLALILAMKTVI